MILKKVIQSIPNNKVIVLKRKNDAYISSLYIDNYFLVINIESLSWRLCDHHLIISGRRNETWIKILDCRIAVPAV